MGIEDRISFWCFRSLLWMLPYALNPWPHFVIAAIFAMTGGSMWLLSDHVYPQCIECLQWVVVMAVGTLTFLMQGATCVWFRWHTKNG